MAGPQQDDQQSVEAVEEDQEYQALPDELKKTTMSRDQKVAFHQGMNSWDSKFTNLFD